MFSSHWLQGRHHSWKLVGEKTWPSPHPHMCSLDGEGTKVTLLCGHFHSYSREKHYSACYHHTCTVPTIRYPHTMSDHSLLSGMGMSATERVLWFLPPPLPIKPLILHYYMSEDRVSFPSHSDVEVFRSNRANINSSWENSSSNRGHHLHCRSSHLVWPFTLCCLHHIHLTTHFMWPTKSGSLQLWNALCPE